MATAIRNLFYCNKKELVLVLQLPSSDHHHLQMDPQVSEKDSVTPEHLFAADLLTFVLNQYEISWQWAFYLTSTKQHYFRRSIGQAILNAMIQKATAIRASCIIVLPENGSWNPENLKNWLSLALLQRPGREFEMLVICNSILCRIALALAKRGDLRFVDDIVGIIARVMRVLVGNENWRWLEARSVGLNKVVRIPDAA